MDNEGPLIAITIVVIVILFGLVITNSGSKFCPKCGERYTRNIIYCDQCGVELLERGHHGN